MTLQAWGSAALLVLGSIVVGQALNLLGLRCRAAGPAVGLSALIVLAAVSIKLPGRAVTAASVLLVVALAALVVVIRGRRASRPATAAILTLPIVGFGAAIPFIANGRTGLLGVSLDNDTANHLEYAQSLRQPAVAARYGVSPGYPLGPHSLADAVATGLGVRLDLAFVGLLVATVLITGLVGAASLPGVSSWCKPIAGVLAALLYLPAAYYAEASFKELLLGVMLLGIVLHVEELRVGWTATGRDRWLGLIALSVLCAAAIYTYSYPALAWIGVTLALWAAAELVTHLGWLRQWRPRLLDLGPPAALAGMILLVLLVPTLGGVVTFARSVGVSPSASGVIAASSLGNLAGPLSPYEALGIWNQTDFRFAPANLFHAGELSALALAVLVVGVLWSIRRRELILPAAVAACAFVFWRSNQGQSPYVAAKALVIGGPVVGVAQSRALLGFPAFRAPRWIAAGRLAVMVGFLVAAMHSSYDALRSEPVWAPESTRELLALGKRTRGQSLLFLGASDYADWIFSDSDMSALSPDSVSMAQAIPRPNKPPTYATALDFDNVDPSSINRFDWVITTNTTYASQPPPGVRLVRRLRMYELWRRVGQIAPRETIEPSGAPGAVLSCRVPAERQLSRQRGIAAVMAAPAVAAVPAVGPAGTVSSVLKLRAGTWNLSLQYASDEPLRVSAGGRGWPMPAYNDRPGPFFAVGSVASTGAPLTVTVHEQQPSALTGPNLISQPGAVAAVPDPDPRRLIPLRRACGRYVDWFQLRPS
ncbi:MAG: hypothetical protein JOZ07_03810 [Solirubrobacterales bacterium]|nr:hypothetical protein [Solirubrobacterales bacterium]